MIQDRIALVVYATYVVAVSFVHDPGILLACLALPFICALPGGLFVPVLRRTITVLVIFNSTVTASYAAYSYWLGVPAIEAAYALVALNARSGCLTASTLIFFTRVPPYRAFSFSKDLSYLAAATFALVQTYRRVSVESLRALESRTPKRPKAVEVFRHAAALALLLLRRAERDALETTMALKSRGLPL